MQDTLHIGKVIITDPPSYVFFQLLLPLGISPSVAATCQFFQPWLHLGFGLWMHRELAFAFHHIKGVTEVFHSSHVWHYDLILVDFEIVRSDVCRRLPSDSASPRTPLPWAIAFPLLGQLRDFHPLAGAHAERTYEECLARTCRTRHPYIFIWTFQQSLPDRWQQKFVKSFIINFCSFMNYMWFCIIK